MMDDGGDDPVTSIEFWIPEAAKGQASAV